jgi:hypothetical protein
MNPRDDDKILLKENDNYMYQVSRSTAYEQSPKMLFYCTYTM